MNKFIKIFCLLLALLLLVGCGKQPVTKVSIGMNSDEIAISKEIRKLYATVNESNINHYIFNSGYQFTEKILDSVKETMHGATLKSVVLKELHEFDEFTAYAFAAYFSGGAKELLINDILLIATIEEVPYIVLQQMYSAKAQEEIIDVCVSYKEIANNIFSACSKKFGAENLNPVTTTLSITDTVNNFINEEGKVLGTANGLVYDFALTLEDIAKGVTGEPDGETVDVVEETAFKADVIPVEEKLSDGRELVWHLEFTGNKIEDLASSLNTGPDTMSPDRKVLFTSTGPENYFIEDGSLVLRITKDPTKNVYTTAKSVSTSGRMAYKYGYVEMRAIVPYQRAVWPSFWMQSATPFSKANYFSEIDILEGYSSSNQIGSTLHKWGKGKHSGLDVENKIIVDNWKYTFKNPENLNNEYHTYGFEWDENFARFYVDDEMYASFPIDEEHDFDKEILPGMQGLHDFSYLLFNNEIFSHGGGWPVNGWNIQVGEEMPIHYYIDYVRLYQKDGEEIKYGPEIEEAHKTWKR